MTAIPSAVISDSAAIDMWKETFASHQIDAEEATRWFTSSPRTHWTAEESAEIAKTTTLAQIREWLDIGILPSMIRDGLRLGVNTTLMLTASMQLRAEVRKRIAARA